MKDLWRIPFCILGLASIVGAGVMVYHTSPEPTYKLWVASITLYMFAGCLIWIASGINTLRSGILVILWLPSLWWEKLKDWIVEQEIE